MVEGKRLAILYFIGFKWKAICTTNSKNEVLDEQTV